MDRESGTQPLPGSSEITIHHGSISAQGQCESEFSLAGERLQQRRPSAHPHNVELYLGSEVQESGKVRTESLIYAQQGHTEVTYINIKVDSGESSHYYVQDKYESVDINETNTYMSNVLETSFPLPVRRTNQVETEMKEVRGTMFNRSDSNRSVVTGGSHMSGRSFSRSKSISECRLGEVSRWRRYQEVEESVVKTNISPGSTDGRFTQAPDYTSGIGPNGATASEGCDNNELNYINPQVTAGDITRMRVTRRSSEPVIISGNIKESLRRIYSPLAEVTKIRVHMSEENIYSLINEEKTESETATSESNYYVEVNAARKPLPRKRVLPDSALDEYVTIVNTQDRRSSKTRYEQSFNDDIPWKKRSGDIEIVLKDLRDEATAGLVKFPKTEDTDIFRRRASQGELSVRMDYGVTRRPRKNSKQFLDGGVALEADPMDRVKSWVVSNEDTSDMNNMASNMDHIPFDRHSIAEIPLKVVRPKQHATDMDEQIKDVDDSDGIYMMPWRKSNSNNSGDQRGIEGEMGATSTGYIENESASADVLNKSLLEGWAPSSQYAHHVTRKSSILSDGGHVAGKTKIRQLSLAIGEEWEDMTGQAAVTPSEVERTFSFRSQRQDAEAEGYSPGVFGRTVRYMSHPPRLEHFFRRNTLPDDTSSSSGSAQATADVEAQVEGDIGEASHVQGVVIQEKRLIHNNPYNGINQRFHSTLQCPCCLFFCFLCCAPAVYFMQVSDSEFDHGSEDKARRTGRKATVLYIIGAVFSLVFLSISVSLVVIYLQGYLTRTQTE